MFIGASWVVTEAFGPKYRTVEIEMSNNRTLICEETYNADFAAVFYDVKFTLKDKRKNLIELGKATFTQDNWEENFELLEIGDWLVLSIDQGWQVQLLMNNPNLDIKRDTALSSSQLRYDSLWQSKYDEIPAWQYSGQVRIDSIRENEFYINYEYRIGLNEPFEFYNQTIEYEVDLASGELTTKTMFERNEKKRLPTSPSPNRAENENELLLP